MKTLHHPSAASCHVLLMSLSAPQPTRKPPDIVSVRPSPPFAQVFTQVVRSARSPVVGNGRRPPVNLQTHRVPRRRRDRVPVQVIRIRRVEVTHRSWRIAAARFLIDSFTSQPLK